MGLWGGDSFYLLINETSLVSFFFEHKFKKNILALIITSLNS
jgi:hypothetical protein